MTKKIGWKIKNLRIQNGWTQAEMGQKVGVAQGIVTRWETDKQMPRPDKDRAPGAVGR